MILMSNDYFERIADHLGLDWDDMRRRHHIKTCSTFGVNSRISMDKLDGIWNEFPTRLPTRNCLLEIMNLFPIADHNFVFIFLKFARNAGEAAEHLATFHRLISRFPISFNRSADKLTISVHPASDTFSSKVVFTRLLFFPDIIRTATEKNILPVAVGVDFDPQDETALTTFFGVEPEWNGTRSLVLSAADAVLPFMSADAKMNQSIYPELERRVAILQGGRGAVFDVTRRITDGFGGPKPTLTGIAADMGMSVCKLQRALGVEGASYSSVLDGARQRRVTELLAAGEMSKGQIAYDVGLTIPIHYTVLWQNGGLTPSHASLATIR